MGSLILCHKKRARQPYEIVRVHLRIYTIEELCYYICNNLYLIDYTIMNRQLCSWIDRELGMKVLADKLRDELQNSCTESEFVLQILKGSTVYSQSDIHKIQVMLEQLQEQKEVEKAKYKADSLLESGETAAAILVYLSIVNGDRDDSVEKEFYGYVYGCLGTAYGRRFLYAEAAEAYRQAYEICEEVDMLKAYLYCCYRSLSAAKYTKMLSGNSLYLSMDSLLKEEIERAKREEDFEVDKEKISKWKKEYRRIDKTR